jgi:hypothetical protein
MRSGKVRQLLLAFAGVLAVGALIMAVPATQAYQRHKPHCHNGKVPKRVKIHVRRHGHRVTIRVWKCVKKTVPGGGLASRGAEPAPSIFGVDTGTYDTNSANYGKDVPAARSIGARWDHFVLGSQTATGNFQSSDYWVNQAIGQHMGIVLSFGGIQAACSKSTSNVHSCPPTTAADLRAYQNYVISILTHYHNVVDYYESWVEPNHASQWGGSVNPAQYAALLKAQYQAFQTFNSQHPGSGPGGSNMKLLFGSPNDFAITPGGSDMAALVFTDQVLTDLGGQRAFDGAALHAYRYPPATEGPNAIDCDYIGSVTVRVGTQVPGACAGNQSEMSWSDELTAYEQVFQNHGYGQTPVWLTEFGWPGTSDSSCYSQADYCPSEATQARYVQDAYADLLKLPFVQAALWFNSRDYAPGVSSPDPGFFFHYGLLNYDFSHKPAADDFKTLAAANPHR